MNKTIKNIFFYGLGDFIVTAVNGFLLVPFYITHLSQSNYGAYSVLTTTNLLFTYFIQFGIISGFSRVYFIYKEENKHVEYFNNILTFHIVYSIFLSLIGYLLQRPIKNIIAPSIDSFSYIYATYLSAFFSFIPALCSIKYRLEQKAKSFVLIQLFTAAISLCFVFLFLGWLKMSLKGLILSSCISSGLLWIYFIKNIAPSFKPIIKWPQLSNTFKVSFPIFFSYISSFLVTKFSIILLQNYVPLQQLALFSFAQQLGSIPLLISIAIGKAIQPVLYAASKENLKSIYNHYDDLYKIIMISTCGLLLIYSNEIIYFFGNKQYDDSLVIFWIIVCANFFYLGVALQNTLLIYFLKFNILMISQISAALISILLNYLLIPKYGIQGAACAILFPFLGMTILNFYAADKLIKRTGARKSLYFLLLVVIFISIEVVVQKKLTHSVIIIVKIIFSFVIIYLSIKKIKLILSKLNYH